MTPAAGSGHPAQPQVPVEVGRNLLTLDPLRALGPDALDTQRLPGFASITLREVEIAHTNTVHLVTLIQADDIFNCDPTEASCDPIPGTGTITRAAFDVEFADSPELFTVEICLPDTVTLS